MTAINSTSSHWRPPKILITGLPGCGKTTLVRGLAEALIHLHPVGFFTAELRQAGKRIGFKLRSLDGLGALLAHVDIKSHCRVGRYGVDVAGFERFLKTLPLHETKTGLMVIDEIGKMECSSDLFRATVAAALTAPSPLLATIAMKGGAFMDKIKQHPATTLITLRRNNQEALFRHVLNCLQV